MPEQDYKEVYFHEYCKTCKYEETPEIEDPCNLYSHKPVNWKEKDEQ